MNSIGETLRRERLRRNLDLEQISSELKISARFLEAIEDERFDKLPAGVFAKSFVRQYARYLGLDEEELATEVQRALQPEPVLPRPENSWQPAVPEIHVPRVEAWEAVGDRGRFQWSSSLPALAMVVVVMLVCSGVYSFWQRARRPVMAREAPPAPTRALPPAQSNSAPAGAPAAQPAAPEGVPAEPQTAATQPVQATPVPPAQKSEPNSADRPAPETPASAAAKPAVPEAAPNPNAAVHVELTAAEPVWVLAKADGKYLFSGTLEPNQTRLVEATGTLLLRLGNAGGVSITLNGKPIGTVGAKGQVKDVQFTSGGFQIVAAPKPSLPLVDEELI